MDSFRRFSPSECRSASDKDSYIDAYIDTRNGSEPALPYIEEWFNKKEYDALLIHGEPGHGKTLLCKKAIYEYRK